MKSQWATVALTAMLAFSLVGGTALAQQYTNPSANQPTTSTNQMTPFQPKLEKAKDLIGAKVVDQNGKELGKIEDIVLTPQRDAISYVALSYSGKFFAVPWSAFELRTPEQGKVSVVLTTGVDYLKTAQGFNKDHWPMMADRNWPLGTEARNVPAEQPRNEQGMATNTNMKYLRLSKLIGTDVKSDQGTGIGKLNNIMLDWSNGRVAYGILSVDRSFLGTGGKFAAIPWSVIRIDVERGIALLNVDKNTLQAIAFDENHFPNFADPQYSRGLYQRFNVRPYWEALGYVPGQPERHTTAPGAEHSEHSQSYEGTSESMD